MEGGRGLVDRKLQVFLAVARIGSITRAAEALHMTQPAVTSQIKKFEDRYDVRFFDRNRDGVSLTEVGRSVCHYAERISGLYDELEKSLQHYKQRECDSLILGVTPAAADYLLRRVIQQFCRQHRDVDVQIEMYRPDTMAQRLSHVDFAVVEDSCADNGLKLEHEWRDRLVVLVNPGHALASRPYVTLTDLAQHSILCSDPSGSIRQLISLRAREEGISSARLHLNAEFGGLDALMGAVQSDLGVVMLPLSRVDGMLGETGMVTLKLEPALEQVFYMFRNVEAGEKSPVHTWLEYIRVYEGLARPVG